MRKISLTKKHTTSKNFRGLVKTRVHATNIESMESVGIKKLAFSNLKLLFGILLLFGNVNAVTIHSPRVNYEYDATATNIPISFTLPSGFVAEQAKLTDPTNGPYYPRIFCKDRSVNATSNAINWGTSYNILSYTGDTWSGNFPISYFNWGGYRTRLPNHTTKS